MTSKVALAGLAKKLTKGRLAGSAETQVADDRWIPTGALSLDGGLGGGAAIGKILMLFGEKSGGKTTTAARIAGIAQTLCRNCFRVAGRDAWHLFMFVEEDGTGGIVQVQPHVNEPREFTRVEAHRYCVSHVLELSATVGTEAFYSNADGKLMARVVRLAGTVEATPPTEEEAAELGESARWSAKGHCGCYGERIYRPEESPPKKEASGESPDEYKAKRDLWHGSTGAPRKADGDTPKKYEERLAAWRDDLRLNSYSEFVVSWMDVEESYHKEWFANLGVDNRRIFHIRPTNAEEAIDIGHALALTNECDLLVIDSIAQLVPQKEISASMEEWQQGLQARLVNKAARKLLGAMAKQSGRCRPLTQIWINQTREKIGVMFGDPTVKPGGKGQEFAIHAEVKFQRSKEETINDQYGTKDEVLVVSVKETISFKITKNKTAGTKGVTGSYVQSMRSTELLRAGSVMEEDYVFKLAMHYLVVADKKKGTYTISREEGTRDARRFWNWDPVVFESQKDILAAIREDSGFLTRVRWTLLQHMTRTTGGGAAVSAEE